MALQPNAPLHVNRDAEIKETVNSYIRQKTENLGYEIRIKRISLNPIPKLPDGNLEYEVMAPRQWEGWGAANLAVVIRLGDTVVANISMRVEVEAIADMVVTLRQLDHGTIISSSDVAIQKRDIATVSGKFTGNIADVVGKVTRTTFKANSVVRADQVEKVPLVKSGQMVTILAENAVMKISVAGKARSSGAEGDLIMVQNLNSLKEIQGRVLNSSTVQVGF
ncbi:MAG: flagellar basal body P-ring formation chaperone FlgA [Deltaproteobacteria bacterium]